MELFIDLVKDLGTDQKYKRKWLVRCNFCKKEYIALANNIKHRGRSVCTECSPKLVYKDKYHDTKHPLYITWSLLLRRVDNTSIRKSERDQKYYDGISVCEEWKVFKTFKDWAESNGYKKGLSIDRIDTTKGYEPSNCRWVNQSVQNANRKHNSKSSTQYSGIVLSGRPNQPYLVRVIFEGKTYLQKRVKTLQEAISIRNTCIMENNLPHPIQEYKGD